MIHHDHHISTRMGDHYLQLALHLHNISSGTNSVRPLRLSNKTINWCPSSVYIYIQKDHICTLKIMWSKSKFGGLWKHQINPACTKSTIVFKILKLQWTLIQKKRRTWQDRNYTQKLHYQISASMFLKHFGSVQIFALLQVKQLFISLCTVCLSFKCHHTTNRKTRTAITQLTCN